MNKQFCFVFLFVFLSSFVYCDELTDVPANARNEFSDTEEAEKKISIDIKSIRDPNVLWNNLLLISNIEQRAEILIALGKMGKGNRQIIDNLNNYLMSMNISYRSGVNHPYIVVSACISAIMELGDSSSYQALFTAVCTGYPEVITSEAFGALEIIPGNLHQFLLNVIWNNPPEEKFTAFRIALNSDRFNVSERGQIAELAFDQALSVAEDNINLNAMRFSAVLALTQIRWTRASALAIKHYYRVQTELYKNIVHKDRLIEAIKCLGAVGDSQAALVLGLQLGLINARTESTSSYDDEMTFAIVQALGLIGDNAAFDHLLYVSNLSYGEHIKAAAREAIGNLKWGR